MPTPVVFVPSRLAALPTDIAGGTLDDRQRLLAFRRETIAGALAPFLRPAAFDADTLAPGVLPALGAVVLPAEVALRLEADDVGRVVRAGGVSLQLGGGRLAPACEPWHLEAVGARHAPSAGEGVVVGIADSWVDGVPGEFNVARADVRAFAADGRPTAADPLPTTHGTEVASLIASASVGLAPQSRLVVASVLRQPLGAGFEGTPVQIASGLEWLAAAAVDGLPVSVVNASFVTPPDPALERALARYQATGIVLVAATGNSRSHVGHPAAAAGVLSVGSTGRDGQPAPSAGRSASDPDIWAPGSGLTPLLRSGACIRSSGTSLAAAVVTGAMARLMSGSADRRASAARQRVLDEAVVTPFGRRLALGPLVT